MKYRKIINGKYVFSFNKKRNGWEIPGGHIEENENWEDAAKREVYEETGATKVKITPICVYKINTFALLCYCEILEIGELPENLSYPNTYKILFDKVKK